ncbi:MAG: PQQ-binding-like beta-propeller repeat protein [Alphaproteobacteria bacterium]|nr:PQQ-binding-like beta-propeller repeat protein [Alphaproteobacteria bacterium]
MLLIRDRQKLARILVAVSCLALSLAACAPRPETSADSQSAAVRDDAHPGRAVYEQWCAACHEDGARSGAPSLEAIRTLNRASVRYTLELGYMQQQARNVPPEELAELIAWLPRDEQRSDDWIEAARCPIKTRRVRLDGAALTSVTFGVENTNNRRQSAAETGLARADMPNLELAWAIAFPQTPTMRSQPVLIGDTIFIAATDAGRLYALDAGSGCVKWVYASEMTLRSSLSFAAASDAHPASILMGDAAGFVHAVDAATGAKLWVSDAKLTRYNRITGTPVVSGGRVFAPLSAIEVNYAGEDDYECCKGQGAIVALDLATGARLWTGTTMEPAQPVRFGRTGTQQWGPSGAIIWSTPTIDEKRGLLYAGTGENTSWPATDTSDAIIAYDMKTGDRRWVFQATKADIWNYACSRRAANCDWPGEYHSPDHDFGATAMLIERPDGRELVIAGQKSGVIWALEPDTGTLVWSNKVGYGSAGGGVHWGLAFDGARIFAPLNDPTGPHDNPNFGPGMHELNAMTGEIEWSYQPNARDCGQDLPVAAATRPAPEWRLLPVSAPVLPPAPVTVAPLDPAEIRALREQYRNRCPLGMSPAPLLVDGAVVTGTTQGMLRIFDGESGEVLFEYQTNREYPDTVNGLPGHGGSLDSAPYIAGLGTLFVQSGYARFGQPPGNVLLAFRPRKD